MLVRQFCNRTIRKCRMFRCFRSICHHCPVTTDAYVLCCWRPPSLTGEEWDSGEPCFPCFPTHSRKIPMSRFLSPPSYLCLLWIWRIVTSQSKLKHGCEIYLKTSAQMDLWIRWSSLQSNYLERINGWQWQCYNCSWSISTSTYLFSKQLCLV